MSVLLKTHQHNNYSQCLPHCEQAVTGRDITGNLIEKITGTVKTWQARSRQRKQLALLDERLLEDVGLTQAEVQHEIAKPFWR